MSDMDDVEEALVNEEWTLARTHSQVVMAYSLQSIAEALRAAISTPVVVRLTDD